MGRRHRAPARPRRRLWRNERGDRQGGRAGQARRRARNPLPRAAARASATSCSNLVAEESDDSSSSKTHSRSARQPQQQLARRARASARRSSTARRSRRAASNAPRSHRSLLRPARPGACSRSGGMAVLIRLAAEGRRGGDRGDLPPLCRTQPDQLRGKRARRSRNRKADVGDKPAIHPWLVAKDGGRLVGYAASSPFRTRPLTAGPSRPAFISPRRRGPWARASLLTDASTCSTAGFLR